MNNSPLITKENFKQEVFEFAKTHYRTQFKFFFRDFWGEFPYKMKGLDNELHFKNFLDWLMIEKILPQTGKTIVEEYLDANPPLSAELRACLGRMKNVVRGEFEVLSAQGQKLKLRHQNQDYAVKTYSKHDLGRGDVIQGRIHEFDEYYRICGIFQTTPASFLRWKN